MTNFAFHCWCCFPTTVFFWILKQWFCDFRAVTIWLWDGEFGSGTALNEAKMTCIHRCCPHKHNLAQDSPCKGIGVWLFFKIHLIQINYSEWAASWLLTYTVFTYWQTSLTTDKMFLTKEQNNQSDQTRSLQLLIFIHTMSSRYVPDVLFPEQRLKISVIYQTGNSRESQAGSVSCGISLPAALLTFLSWERRDYTPFFRSLQTHCNPQYVCLSILSKNKK